MSEGRPSVPVVQNAPARGFSRTSPGFSVSVVSPAISPAIPGEFPERIEGELPDISVGIGEVSVIEAVMIADRPHVGFWPKASIALHYS